VSVVSPQEPRQDEVELLIREARARQRKRWIAAAAVIALVAGAALGVDSILSGGNTSPSHVGGPTPAVKGANACGVHVMQTKILDGSGRVLYREPVPRTFGHQLQCGGSSLWVVFFNGVASSQQAYFGVHSGDGGRTWRAVFTERYFGMKAPHELDSYMGPWTLSQGAAYFVGLCPACGLQPTVSLWVTKDAGRTFRRYEIARLDGYGPTAIHVAGGRVSISARRGGRRRTATVHVA
jgi:hypothetical protein